MERVFEGILSRAERILRIIGFHAHDLNMAPRNTHYYQRGRDKKNKLRFSKSGDKKIEDAYSRHYIWNRPPEKKQEIIEQTKLGQISKVSVVRYKNIFWIL